MDIVDRFISYCKVYTTSDDTSESVPSTARQLNLGKILVDELKDLGLKDAYLDEFGIVYAHLDGIGTKIGVNAHIDTALEVTGEGCNPRIVKNYQGEDIKLNDKYVLSPKQFPLLLKHKGSDLVVTNGDTLLGADDKAGIAIIMGALEYFKAHPEIKHHPISVAFTCDEEIGRGPDHFDIKKMDAEFAFTFDGAFPSNVDYMNFNAKSVDIHIKGVSVHPGSGKGQLINAILLLNEILNQMPKNDTPFDSEDDQGYWHINDVRGNNDEIDAYMILRDFDLTRLNKRVDIINKIILNMKKKYPLCEFVVTFNDQYENMEQYVKKDMRAIEIADVALKKNGLTPVHSRIRGGTDGATFSKMGLITPNLGTGSYNHHGIYEYLVVDEFKKMINVLIDILKI